MRPAPDAPEGPRLAGRYALERLLGSGGMGTVYKAHDQELDEWVALKLIRPELLSHSDALTRFRQEVKLARRVTHPNVARMYDLGDADGRRFLTMELIDGESLSARIARVGPHPVASALTLARDMLLGLGAVHAAGVLHRDLKPDNVLVTPQARVVITDFGVARTLQDEGLAQTGGVVLGTPEYMAPEQVEAQGSLDARADLYAVGTILYELLTGRRAWAGPSPLAAMVARLLRPPSDPRALRPDLPAAVAELVLALMARERDHRPASAAESAQRIEALTGLAGPLLVTPAPGQRRRERDVRLAVLPVQALGAEEAHRAVGLTRELMDALAASAGVRVVPWVDARANARADRLAAARELSRQLGVQVLVDASLATDEAGSRLTVRLLSTDDGFQFWSRRYRGGAGELLRLASTAAEEVATALAADAPRRSARSLQDPEALDLYLRGRRAYHSFWRDEVEKAIGLFDAALLRTPDDPLVMAGAALARARRVALAMADADEPARVRSLAERALRAAPALGEARIALATLEINLGDPVLGARDVRRALEDAPAQSDAHELAGRLLLEVGPISEAIRVLEVAQRFEPGLATVGAQIARGQALLGRWDEAWEALGAEPTGAAHRNYYEIVRARLALWSGNRAMADASAAAAAQGGFTMASVVGYYTEIVRTGDLSPAGLAELGERVYMVGAPARLLCFFRQIQIEILVALSRPAEAWHALVAADGLGFFDLCWLEGCPLLSALHSQPGWAALRDRVEERAQAVRDALRGSHG